MLKRLNHRGDTIVEVLIAIAILGAIIGGGYSIATRSLNGVRISQERSEATKIAESQIETFKSKFYSAKSEPELFAALNLVVTPHPGSADTVDVTPFCFSESGATITINDVDNLAAYPADCILGNGDIYYVSLTPEYVAPTTNSEPWVFTGTVRIKWDRSGGGGTDSLKMVYKISV